MAKEYKTLTFVDNEAGRREMATAMDEYSNEGWILKNKEVSQQGWAFGKTCCLGCLFLPLALLGKKEGIITIVFEREKDEKRKKDNP